MRPERGFTLLETVLALALGGAVLTVAYAAVVRAAAARTGATERTAEVAAARRALLEIASAAEAATPHPFAADASGLTIAQVDPEPSVVRYAVEGTRLVERRTTPFAGPRARPGPPRLLLDGAQGFGVRCYDGVSWSDGWQGEQAPRAIELVLRLADGEEIRTRVVLPLGGDA